MSNHSRLISEMDVEPQPVRTPYISPAESFIKFYQTDIDQSITNRFEKQVNKYPNSIAVKSKISTLTYDQLNKNANRLARAILAQRGEGKEVIALLIEQGASFITGIFGVLKTGKIYVPIDPSIPVVRLTHILEDSQAVLVVTNNKNLAVACELTQNRCQILNIDDIDCSFSTDNLELLISPDTPAYIIYTSGSTGKPKGVLQNHRNALHNCMNNTNALCISPSDRLTLLHSCGVMGAMRGICNALLNGASIYPLNVKEEGLTSLVNWLLEEEITIYHSVATLYRQFVGILTAQEQFPKLRVLILGGESVLQRDIDLYKKHFSANCVAFVSLGSTETGTVRQFIVNKDTQIQGSTVPIGYPIEDMEILLLNEAGEEVACGEVGEIAIKSEYLALGYWQKPELTKAVFQLDPKGGSERIYYTGDLGRFQPDGCLVHMGRKDFQVKIRGFRIEVTEIEMALLSIDAIKEVAVIAREDIPGDKRLVAYIVLNQDSTLTNSELRHYLLPKLPDYMVPSAFVFLDALPLTPNNKLDRLALKAPDASKQDTQASFVAPRNDLERRLTQIWEEVLGMQPIGVTDNFFDLGGHSLAAISLFAQIENKFAKKLPLVTLFQSGTVEALAQTIQALSADNQTTSQSVATTQNKSTDTWSSLVKIQPNGSKPLLFCIHPLGGEILCYRDLARYLGSDQPVYGLQPQGLNGKPPLTKVEDMASLYIKEIQTIQPNGPYYLVGYSFGGILVFEMAQQLYRLGQEVGLLVMIDTCRPGYSQRLPFAKRIALHLDNLLQLRLAYIKQNAEGWSQWGKYMLKHKYKRYLTAARHLLNVVHRLPENDKHLEIIDANALALSEYSFQVYPDKLTLLRTDDKSRDEAVGIEYDPQFGWGDLIVGGLDIHYVPGSHNSLLYEPHVQVVAEKLKVCLDKAYTKFLSY
ncbi:amino acid adenylation domain-containing protein [Tolypothrix sp. NIES-4075]|uniref:AMP-binding protein n=1 Tax=Tolypothrix sp. NIES-4075 TaxID=2005459 RepID=UPI000B5C4429|nr:AMP-binding protein [Tolypothrix sp. NIES-4075]GAX43384.1 amino acid adenylation domain-containing protein [Tolypothrix sp. NIES-4075]